jgi:CelD/BcsL family acetyltransferase involved in cellulose biosynthesis
MVTDDPGLDALAPEWDELLADSEAPTVFLTFAWISAWRQTLGRRAALLVGTARDPGTGELLGIAPFAVEQRSAGPLRITVLVMAGSGAAAPDHLDLIVRHGHPHVAASLWSEIRSLRTWDLIDLDGLRSGSRLAGLAARRTADRDRRVRRTPCPVLGLPGTWEQYRASLGKNLRQNLGRYRRKLEREIGRPTERLVLEPGEAADTVERLAGFHQQVRTARGDRGSYADPAMVDFHRELAVRFLESGRLRLHRLDVAGELAAAISCFRYGDTISFYSTGYDPRLAAYGPGREVMAASIRSAIAEGAETYDFLRGDEPHKRSWGALPAFDEAIRMPIGARGHFVVQAAAVARPLRAGFRRTLRR